MVLPTVLRPIRRWSCAKGRGAPSDLVGQDLAVERRSPRAGRRPRVASLGIALGDEFLAPGPEERVAPSRRMSWARMPSHFHSACQSSIGPEGVGRTFQGVGQAERIGPAVVGVAGVGPRGGGRRRPGSGSQSPIKRWATIAGLDPADLGQGPGDELLRDAHAEAAADQLVPDESLGPVHRGPGPEHGRLLGRLVGLAEGQERLDPVAQGEVAGAVGRRQEQGDGLGHVADGVVRLAEEPVGDAGGLGGPLAELPRGDRLLGLPADQEVDGPGRIGRRGPGEVGGQRPDLPRRSGSSRPGPHRVRRNLSSHGPTRTDTDRHGPPRTADDPPRAGSVRRPIPSSVGQLIAIRIGSVCRGRSSLPMPSVAINSRPEPIVINRNDVASANGPSMKRPRG